MKRTLILCLACMALSGCSRNGEYRYFSELHLIEPAETLLPEIAQRLSTSEFRANYDQTLVDRIGSSFKNFKHIRAYQAVLEDTLIYLMIKTDMTAIGDGLRADLIHPVSKLILSYRSGDDLLTGLDKIANMIKTTEETKLAAALAAYDAQLKAENKANSQ